MWTLLSRTNLCFLLSLTCRTLRVLWLLCTPLAEYWFLVVVSLLHYRLHLLLACSYICLVCGLASFGFTQCIHVLPVLLLEDITSERGNNANEEHVEKEHVEKEQEEYKEIGHTKLIEEVSLDAELDDMAGDVVGESSPPRPASLACFFSIASFLFHFFFFVSHVFFSPGVTAFHV